MVPDARKALSPDEPAVLRVLVQVQATAPVDSLGENFALVASPAGPTMPTVSSAVFKDSMPDYFEADPQVAPGSKWQQLQLIIENPSVSAIFVGIYNPGSVNVSFVIQSHFSQDRLLKLGTGPVSVAVDKADPVVFFKVKKEDIQGVYKAGVSSFLFFSGSTTDRVEIFARRGLFASLYVHDVRGNVRADAYRNGVQYYHVELLLANMQSDQDIHITVRRTSSVGESSMLSAEAYELIPSNAVSGGPSVVSIVLITGLSLLVVLLMGLIVFQIYNRKNTIRNAELYTKLSSTDPEQQHQ